MHPDFYQWTDFDRQRDQPARFTCGWCNSVVGTSQGWRAMNKVGNTLASIHICTFCHRPSYSDENKDSRYPGASFGREIQHVPEPVAAVYNEARECMRAQCFTAAAMLSRKLLMHLAVNVADAKAGEKFAFYVDHLAAKGYVPPNGKSWVDRIRVIGNDSNHELEAISRDDAIRAMRFCEMLLQFIYEFPAAGGTAAPAP